MTERETYLAELVQSLRTEAALCEASKNAGGAQWREGMELLGRKLAAAGDELEQLRTENQALRVAGDRMAHQFAMSDKAVSPFLRGWWKARGNRCTVCETESRHD